MEGGEDMVSGPRPSTGIKTYQNGLGYQPVSLKEVTHVSEEKFDGTDNRTRSNAWWNLSWDITLTIPGLAFLVYALLVAHGAGKPVTESPVPALMNAASYGPTIFPIAFAAVAANLLKSFAAWKLERGISLLDLEYLLSSRTVVSAFTAPFSLRTLTFLAPALMALWAMSPLGGQAALRVMTVVPSTASQTNDFQWLEFMARFPHGGPESSAGIDLLPSAVGSFAAALSGPMSVKKAPRDGFGNVKIPMVEVYTSSDAVEADSDGWFVVRDLDDKDGVRYSSLAGLPFASQDNFTQVANYTLTIDTSYLYTDCSLTGKTAVSFDEWTAIVNESSSNTMSYYNDGTLILWHANIHLSLSETPLEMVWTSIANEDVTNATCTFTMSYVQAEISCHCASCEATRVRPVTRPNNVTVNTVLDGFGPGGISYPNVPPYMGFFKSFLFASLTYWDRDWRTDPYSTPIEYYFTNPGAPFAATPLPGDTWRGADIYPIGDALFSRRFAQLLNTFWIVSIAPFTHARGIPYRDPLNNDGSEEEEVEAAKILRDNLISNATGTVTPDVLVMRPHAPWLAILFVSSAIMFAAAVLAAALGFLREGPDVLDRATSFLAYNHHAGHLERIDVSMRSEWMQQRLKLGLQPEGKLVDEQEAATR
ncbi:hypothetical protein ACHAQA_007276 [Verticillium albo-atrum]